MIKSIFSFGSDATLFSSSNGMQDRNMQQHLTCDMDCQQQQQQHQHQQHATKSTTT